MRIKQYIPIELLPQDDVALRQQARFTQSVSALQFLGFVRPSKRKTDHMQRLTW